MEQVRRIENTSSASGNLLITETAYLIQELPVARAGIYDMRMRIAERRHEQSALRIDIRIRLGHFVHRSEVGNTVVLHQEIGIAECTRMIHLSALLAQDAFWSNAHYLADILNTSLHGG